jgi:hypothetical protein
MMLAWTGYFIQMLFIFLQDLYAKYIFNHEQKPYETKKLGNTINPQWNMNQVHGFAKVMDKVSTKL